MAKYFKFVGWFLIISFIAGAIGDLIAFFINVSSLAKANQILFIFLYIIIFIACIIIGPALGLLFVSYGGHLEEAEEEKERIEEIEENNHQDTNETIAGQTVLLLRDIVDQTSGISIPKGSMGKIITDYGKYYRVQFFVDNTPISLLERKEYFSL